MAGVRYVSAWDEGLRNLGAHWVRDDRKSRGVNDSLNSLMQMDHVIRVDGDGLVYGDVKDMYGPESFYAPVDKDGQYTPDTEREIREQLRSQGWEPEGGWSNQQGTKSDDYTMHDSEFIGGSLAEHILTTPGYWVACEVRTDEDDEETDNHAGWLIAHHPYQVEKVDLLGRITRGQVVSNVGVRFTVKWEDGSKTSEYYDRKGSDWREAAA
jgi:hypothetical protein